MDRCPIERTLSTLPCETLTKIALERPSSVHKLLPNLADGWLLDTYFVGPENELLRYLFDDERVKTLGAIAPVILYGEKSLGKTALTVTLAVRWSRITDERPLVITTGQTFCQDFANAVEIDDIEAFRKRHRECKMLVVDDLEAFNGKIAAQEEFAATIDALVEAGRPLLVTNCQLPSSSKSIKPNLASRLSAGFSLLLNRPSKATRNALIEALVAKFDPHLSVEHLIAVAGDLDSAALSPVEIRDLVKVAQQNRSSKGELDPSIVAALMRQQISGVAPDIGAITKSVCRRMQVKLTDVRGSSREAPIMRARSLAIYLSRKLTTLSLLQIGEYFSGRDHSTILHSIRKIKALVDIDSELANLCRDVEAELFQ